MTTIITRAGKGTPLTNDEMDTNLTNLNTDKVELSALADTTGSGLVGFKQSGTGAVNRTVAGKLSEVVSVRDFGAVGDGITDDTAAIQAAIDSSKTIFVPRGTYLLTDTLILTESYSGIIGDTEYPYFHIDPAIGPAFKITTNGGTSINEFSRIENIAIWADGKPDYSTGPIPTNCAISVAGSLGTNANGVSRLQLNNIRIIGFSTGIYLKEHTNTQIYRVIFDNHTNWSGEADVGQYVGIYFDGTPNTVGGISPNASTEVINCIFNGTFAPSAVQAIGFFIRGPDIRDIFFDRCETAGGNIGWWIESTGTIDYNCDIHIRRPICDIFTQSAIYILNCSAPGNITIDGGYFAASISSPTTNLASVWVENSTNIAVVGGCQFLGFNNSTITDDGIRIYNSYNCTITGNLFCNHAYGISLQASSNNTVVGNVINAETTDLESSPLLYDAIRLIGNSAYNTISSNSISGLDASNKYSAGINVEAGSQYNTIANKTVNPVSVKTPYGVGDVNNIYNFSTNATQTIQANKIDLTSSGAVMTFLGNSGTYPFIFKDGGGNVIAGINVSGVFVKAPLP